MIKAKSRVPIKYNGTLYQNDLEIEFKDADVKGLEKILYDVETLEEAKEDKTLEEMTIAELKAYAEENKIDLQGLNSKASKNEILEAILESNKGE